MPRVRNTLSLPWVAPRRRAWRRSFGTSEGGTGCARSLPYFSRSHTVARRSSMPSSTRFSAPSWRAPETRWSSTSNRSSSRSRLVVRTASIASASSRSSRPRRRLVSRRGLFSSAAGLSSTYLARRARSNSARRAATQFSRGDRASLLGRFFLARSAAARTTSSQSSTVIVSIRRSPKCRSARRQ